MIEKFIGETCHLEFRLSVFKRTASLPKLCSDYAEFFTHLNAFMFAIDLWSDAIDDGNWWIFGRFQVQICEIDIHVVVEGSGVFSNGSLHYSFVFIRKAPLVLTQNYVMLR